MLTLLIKNRLDAQLGISRYRYGTDEKKKRNQILMLILMVFVGLICMGYVGGYAYILYYVGLEKQIPLFGYLISCMICLLFTAIKTNGELFAFKDYEMLSSLPIKTTTLIGSRVLVLYIWNTVFTLLVMIPTMIMYAIYVRPNALYYILSIPGILLTAFLPTVIAVIFGAILTSIASKFRYYQAAQSVLVMLFALLFFAGSFAMSGNPGQVFTETGDLNKVVVSEAIDKLTGNILTNVYPAKWFQEGFVDGNFVSLLLFLLSSLLCYALFLFILAKFFGKINTAVTTYHTSGNYKITHLEKRGVLVALYKKELKYYTSCSIYLTNTAIGALMAVIFCGGIVFVGVDKMMVALKVRQYEDQMMTMLPWIAWMFLVMVCTSCCSLSLEGKRMWILQSLPIQKKTIYDSKILLNLSVSLPSSFLCSILLCIALKPGIGTGIFYFITPLVFCTLSAVWGMYVNQKITQLVWESELKVVKQSVTTALGMFPGMVLMLCLGGIQILLPINDSIYFFIITIMAAVAVTYLYLKRKDANWREVL